jgi:PAS domain S-box-containing protein
MTGSAANPPGRRTDFASFLRARRDDILAQWEKAARVNPRAAKLERLQLINFIPVLFDRIADVVEQFLAGGVAELSPGVAARHALDRLKEGFDLGEVVNELALLRDCILRLWQESLETADRHGAEHQILTRAVDQAIAASVDCYTEARDRMLRALDRVSSTALEARDLDELLEQLVETFQEEVASVDTVAILLHDGDVLRVRAARGHEADPSIGFVIGDGFAGTIAAERTPRLLRCAATDPLVSDSEAIRSQGTKALYGVPLIEGGELVGVAYMGSSTAEEFSEQDVVLFESMTSRASAGIYQQILRDRSEQRARELEESEQKFEATFENAAVGMAHLGLDGSWLRLNKKYCEILGYTHDELMQLTVQALTHPDDLRQDLEMRHRLAASQVQDFVWEKRYVRKDGRIVWVDLSVGAVRDAEARPRYLVTTAMDITRRKETEALLREREERLRLVVDANGIGAFDFYPQTGRLEWSIHAKRNFGLSPDVDVDYGVFLRGLHPDDRQRVVAIVKNTLQHEDHGVFGAEFRTIGIEDGRERWLSARGMATFDAAGKPERFFGFTLDITEQKRAEERLRESDRRKDEFIAMLGHELRNPLAAIRSATELIKLTCPEDGPLQRAHGVLERQSAHMSRLIDGLLEVSRISRGKIRLDRETVDARKIIDSVFQDRKSEFEDHELQLTIDLPPEPVWIWVDHVRLAQVVDNLVGNAIKFTEPPGRITVTVHEEDMCVSIRIRDTGVGIRPEMLERLFKPFQQEKQGIARASGGLGLGLAVAKGLVELHGGSIQANSGGPGAGAEFEVRLPVTAAPREAPQPVGSRRAPRRRILIVEDNADAGQMLRELLELSGHEVTVVRSGRDALDALAHHGANVVLCDLGLPGMSGYDLARAIRKDPALTEIPLVAVSGYGQPEDRRRAAEAGFDDHLTKPVDLAALAGVLDQLGPDA